MKYLKIFLLLLIFTCCDSKSNEVEKDIVTIDNGTLESISWIEGQWIDSTTFRFKTPPQQLIEEWTLFPDSLSGIGKMVKGSDTIITERLTIRLVNEKLTYIARPVNHTMISFSNLVANDSVFVVENKINKFPSKISYFKKGNTEIDIKMEGSSSTKPVVLINSFVKMIPVSF